MTPEIESFIYLRFLCWSAVLSRIAGLFLFAPFFGGRFFFSNIKVILVISMSFLAMQYVPDVIPLDTPLIEIVLIDFLNFTYGFAAGLVANIIFYALEFSGDIYGYQLGFAAATIFDPQTETENVIVAQLVSLVSLYIFVILKGPTILLGVILRSFEIVPVSILSVKGEFSLSFVQAMGKIIEMGMQIGLPMIVFMILVTFVLGIMSKLLPQLNVFVVGIPLKILVGMVIIIGLMPVWADIIVKYTWELGDWITDVMGKF